jgi:hypothetical protein
MTCAVLIVLLTAACQSSGPTQITTVDRVLGATDMVNAPYTNILVVDAVGSRDSARNIELGITGELKAVNVEAHSFVRESSSTEPTEAAIQKFIDDVGVNGVIVVSAKLTGAELTQHEEQVDIQAVTQGGSLLGFFRSDYKDVTRPNQAETSDYTLNVSLVSDFYDVETDKRVYSIESSTMHGQTRYEIVMDQSKAIVVRLKADGMIR